jgi:hypothetical protein
MPHDKFEFTQAPEPQVKQPTEQHAANDDCIEHTLTSVALQGTGAIPHSIAELTHAPPPHIMHPLAQQASNEDENSIEQTVLDCVTVIGGAGCAAGEPQI